MYCILCLTLEIIGTIQLASASTSFLNKTFQISCCPHGLHHCSCLEFPLDAYKFIFALLYPKKRLPPWCDFFSPFKRWVSFWFYDLRILTLVSRVQLWFQVHRVTLMLAMQNTLSSHDISYLAWLNLYISNSLLSAHDY